MQPDLPLLEPTFRIGLAPIPVGEWLAGGEADAARKLALRAAQPAEVWGEAAGSRTGQAEAATMLRAAGLPVSGDAAEPLWAASLAVPDDLCLMERRTHTGGAPAWTLTAASLCAPSFFTAAEAVGRPLARLHAPVTGFGERLLPRVARIFDHLAADMVLERRNWSVVASDALFLPSASPVRAEAAGLDDAALAARLTLRRERQTIRRLPATGGVLFTIRILRDPLADWLAEPDRRAAFAAAWARTLSPQGAEFSAYKGLAQLDRGVRVLLN